MYLFFVRAFNDVDHITPIVWKMNRENHSVAVYCINPEYDIQSDYRLSFLRTCGISVDFIYNDFGDKLGGVHRALRSAMFSGYRMHKHLTRSHLHGKSIVSRSLAKLARTIAKLIYAILKVFFYNKVWSQNIIEKTGAQALCFDHIRPRQYIVNGLLRAAQEKSIPTLALPHGVFIYTNNRVRTGSTEAERLDKFDQFDYIITQNDLRKDVLARAGVQREKIFVLGSARYCEEWMAQNKKNLPRKTGISEGSNGKLRAVFMTTRFAYRIDVDRMLKTFELLSRIDGIEVVVKPHTRTGKEGSLYEDIPLPNAADISSVELCEWADVMLVIASSIIIESLVLDKPALYLKYLHENTTRYEELGACWTIHDESELQEALGILKDNKRKVPYSSNDVSRFLLEIIYGGIEKRDVLQDYEQFIVRSNNKSG
jgi:hypothetical protein